MKCLKREKLKRKEETKINVLTPRSCKNVDINTDFNLLQGLRIDAARGKVKELENIDTLPRLFS